MTTTARNRSKAPEQGAGIDRLTDDLAAGIRELAGTESWQQYLDFQASLPLYSFQNMMLVMIQCPGATWVMPLGDAASPKPGTWAAISRTRREGERDLMIRKPAFRVLSAEESRDGREHTLRRFIWVPVLDASQTEGDDLPSPVRLLDGDDPQCTLGRVTGFIRAHGFTVDLVPSIPGSAAHGDCDFTTRRIRVCTEGRTRLQQVKTAIHESAHMLLHEGHLDRGRMELEAESVAYVVSRHVGLQTADYSFGYVLSWSGGDPERAQKAIRKSGARIQEASRAILEGIGAIESRAREDQAVAA